MAHDFGNEKHQAHELIERLAPRQVSAVVGQFEAMLYPVSRAIANAPVDDEPLTPEEQQALDQACEWMKHNQGIPHEQVLAEPGVSPEEIERSKNQREAYVWTIPQPCVSRRFPALRGFRRGRRKGTAEKRKAPASHR
ncbi:MAG TPA: hypothetical protein VJP02_04365 [Candidatus Sulfotelmatobacter sp.]|nr:hypothetical protein [Candidatus Sulfotelmatobacter sp.]